MNLSEYLWLVYEVYGNIMLGTFVIGILTSQLGEQGIITHLCFYDVYTKVLFIRKT